MKTIDIAAITRSNGVLLRNRIEQIKLLASLDDGKAAVLDDVKSTNSGPYYGLTSAAKRLGFMLRSGFSDGQLYCFLIKAKDYDALASERARAGLVERGAGQ